MVDLQTISVILAATSIVIAATYYIMVIGNTIRTRQAQLFMQIYQGYSSEKLQNTYYELLHFEWDDYADFERKYGSGDHPELAAEREAHWAWFDGMGVLLKKKLIDPEVVFETLGHGGVLFMWTKFESIIKAQREIYNMPLRLNGFEYLAEQMKKMTEQRGFKVDVPDTFDRYVEK